MRTYKFAKKLPVIGNRNEHFLWNKEVWGAFIDFPDCHIGKHSIVIKPDKVRDYLPEIFDRYPNLPICLKVNFDYPNKGFNINTYIIKNIAWLLGIAPRVYDIAKIEDTDGRIYKTQILEYLIGEFPHKDDSPIIWESHLAYLADYYIGTYGIDWYSANFINDKLVDFDEFYFTNKKKYGRELKERFVKTAYWGSNTASYQDLPNLEIRGCRSHDRFKLLGMLDLDLTGKTVLDIGCSGGQALYWARERGAERIVGLDIPEIAKVAFEMANFHECFDIETIGCDLTQNNIQEIIKEKTGLDKFDIVVMFSVNAHIGFHQYMRDLCKETLFLECNAAKMENVEREEYPEELKKLGYTEFEYRGEVKESGTRSLFICH